MIDKKQEEPRPFFSDGKPCYTRRILFNDGEPCYRNDCLSHVIQPCEGCGRIQGKGVVTEAIVDIETSAMTMHTQYIHDVIT